MFLNENVIVGVILSGLHGAVIDVALLLHIGLQLVVRVAHFIQMEKFH
jgi:hypothetical protein